jgi:hypothetical protein
MPSAKKMGSMSWKRQSYASAIVEYFQPLLDWPREQNKGEKEGWTLPADPLK